jgi:asparaginyl-tRNA synthetase
MFHVVVVILPIISTSNSSSNMSTSGEEEAAASPPFQRILKLSQLSPDQIGAFVKLHGWIYSTRTQGAGSLLFMDLGDGSTVTPTRCIAAKPAAVEEAASEEDAAHAYGSTNFLSNSSGANNDEAAYSKLSFDELTTSSSLSIGCSVMLFGYVAAPPAGTTQSYEVKVTELYLIGGVQDASKYPIQKSILKKPLALRAQYHARFRAPLLQQIMTIRSQALFAVHEFFHTRHVPLLDPNIMTSSDCEGAGEVFKVSPQFFTTVKQVEEPVKKNKKKGGGDKDAATEEAAKQEEEAVAAAAKVEEEKAAAAAAAIAAAPEVGLTVSSQLPLEAIAMGTGAVYTCQKSFRAEKSDTNKHLAEFLHVEYEEYFITLDDLLTQAESFVKHVMVTVLDRCRAQYDFLNNNATSPPEFHGHADYLRTLLDKPFVRMTHAQAIDAMLRDLRDKVKYINADGKEVKLKFKEMPKHGEDLGSEHEKYLVQKFGTFVVVTHWPSAIKSFYMKQCGDGTCEAFDLLAPLVGELFGGSMREWRYNELEAVMTKKNMDFKPLQWFVDLRKDGTAPHGGWGMGFDRLVMFLTNAQSVRDVVPYPVYYGHCPY